MLTTNFIYTGYKEFTKNGYLKASQKFKDLPKSYAGNVLITGSNSGIGLATAKLLYEKGAHVHLACRNEERAENARKEILDSCSSQGQVSVHKLDISDLKSIKPFITNLKSTQPNLNFTALVNNAGCMVHGTDPKKRILQSNNYEINCATNSLGTYLLTDQFLKNYSSSLKKVVTVSSGGMYTKKLEPNLGFDKNWGNFPKDATGLYASNKRQQVVFMEELAKIHSKPSSSNPIFFATMHPGWADTAAVRTAMPDFYERFQGNWRTPEMGADTIVYLLVEEQKMSESGKFWLDREIKPTKLTFDFSWGSDDGDRKVLMKNYEKVVKEFC